MQKRLPPGYKKVIQDIANNKIAYSKGSHFEVAGIDLMPVKLKKKNSWNLL
jgi:hypothetical protein